MLQCLSRFALPDAASGFFAAFSLKSSDISADPDLLLCLSFVLADLTEHQVDLLLLRSLPDCICRTSCCYTDLFNLHGPLRAHFRKHSLFFAFSGQSKAIVQQESTESAQIVRRQLLSVSLQIAFHLIAKHALDSDGSEFKFFCHGAGTLQLQLQDTIFSGISLVFRCFSDEMLKVIFPFFLTIQYPDFAENFFSVLGWVFILFNEYFMSIEPSLQTALFSTVMVGLKKSKVLS